MRDEHAGIYEIDSKPSLKQVFPWTFDSTFLFRIQVHLITFALGTGANELLSTF